LLPRDGLPKEQEVDEHHTWRSKDFRQLVESHGIVRETEVIEDEETGEESAEREDLKDRQTNGFE
jgi:hypothetical protein